MKEAVSGFGGITRSNKHLDCPCTAQLHISRPAVCIHKMRSNITDRDSSSVHPFVLVMKGCRNASAGVHLLSGFKERQRSNRSTNAFNSLTSTSFKPFTLAINLVLRSRVGLEKLMVRTTSFCKSQPSNFPEFEDFGIESLPFPSICPFLCF